MRPRSRPERVYTNRVYLVATSVSGQYEALELPGEGRLRYRSAEHGELAVIH